MHNDLGLYVIGALDDPREFEAHLQGCAECRQEVAALRRMLEVIDENAAAPPVPANLKARTLAAVRESRDDVIPLAPRRRTQPRWYPVLAAAAVIVFAAGFGLRTLTTDGFSADRVIRLAVPRGGDAFGVARIDDTPTGQIVELEIEGLPPAPAGKSYECWFVGPNDSFEMPNRVSAGRFKAGEGTFRMQAAADPGDFPNMGVTLEPDDGNPQRTGKKVLITVPSPR